MTQFYMSFIAAFNCIAYTFNKPSFQPLSISPKNALPVYPGKTGYPVFYTI